MPIMKRATATLANRGLPDLEVQKGMYGYYVNNRTYRKQRGTLVRKTVQEAVDAVLIRGERPDQLD